MYFPLITLVLTLEFSVFKDTVQALVADCEHPSVKRMKNIEAYMERCRYHKIKFYVVNR